MSRDALLDEATYRLAAAYCEPIVARHFSGSTLENCVLAEAPHRDRFAKVFRLVGADGSEQVVVAEAMGFGADVEGPPVMRNVEGVMCEMGTTDYFIEILASMAERGEQAAIRTIEEAARAGNLAYVLAEVTNLDDQARIEAAITPFIVNQATIGNLTWD